MSGRLLSNVTRWRQLARNLHEEAPMPAMVAAAAAILSCLVAVRADAVRLVTGARHESANGRLS